MLDYFRKEALKFHKKGRGNGYVIQLRDERIYFSGDTEDIPEMRALQNIDKAFFLHESTIYNDIRKCC